jgi:1,4-dihydroxy-2-naphthoyl-CoA hydrolase
LPTHVSPTGMHDATRQPSAHRLEAYSPKRLVEDAGSHHPDLIECACMTDPGAGGSAQPQITQQQLVNLVPFASVVGAELMSATPEEVKGRLEWSEERCTAGGVLHGGALMTLADTLGALCALLNLPPGTQKTSTIESKSNFFRAVREGHVESVSRPLHAGRSTIVWCRRIYSTRRAGASGR